MSAIIKRRIVWLLSPAIVLFALLIGICVVIVISIPPTAHLPGGTELSLAAVTHGKTNVYVPGGMWGRLINRFVPAQGISIGKLKLKPSAPLDNTWRYEDGTVARPNKAAIWLRHSGGINAPPLPIPQDKWYWDLRATLADATGEEWEMRSVFIRFFPLSNTRLDGVSVWDFSSFPRRSKRLNFKIYGRNSSDQWDVLAQFKIPNPAPGRYAKWTPLPLPATRQNGDLEVSLMELVSGTKTINYMPKDKRPFTMATFKVTQGGQPTEAWVPDQMKATDATGNEGDFQIIDYGATNGFIFYDAQSASLSPSEVWRLDMRFCKEKSLAPGASWTSPNLAVRNGVLEPANFATNFQSSTVTLACSQTNLRLNMKPLPEGARLRLVQIVDDRGARLDTSTGGYTDHGFDLQLSIPREAQAIKVTIVLPETRHFQFIAQPTWQKERK